MGKRLVYDENGNPIGEMDDGVSATPAPQPEAPYKGPPGFSGQGYSLNPLKAPVAIGNNFSNAPPPGAVDTSVPDHPGIDESRSGGESEAEGVESSDAAKRFVFGYGMPRMGPAVVVEGPGSNYSNAGGAEGLDTFKEAYVDAPSRFNEAADKEASLKETVETNRAIGLSNLHDSQKAQLAEISRNRILAHQELLRKEEVRDLAIERYSRDLADTGQFWLNPGNIIQGIAASFMAWANPKDPHVGFRMLDQQIQADWQKRRELADMHLGELRSNVSSYRQAMGDKERGDHKALEESYKVAMIDLDRMAATAQGSLVKAQAEKAKAALQQKVAMLKMDDYRRNILQPAHLSDPRIAAANSAAAAALPKGVGLTRFADYGKSNVAQPSAGAGRVGGGAVQTAPGSGVPSAQTSDYLKDLMKPMDPKLREAIERRAPGSSRQLESEKQDYLRYIFKKVNGDPNKFNAASAEFEDSVGKDMAAISTAAQPLVAKIDGYRRMRVDRAIIENTAARVGVSPDSLMGQGSKEVFGKSLVARYDDITNALMRTDPDKASKWEHEKQQVKDAVARYEQLLAGNTNAYFKETSGGSVTSGEEARNTQYIRSGWRAGGVFVDDQSRKAQAELRNATNSASHPVTGTLWRILNGVGSAPLDSPGVEKPGRAVDKAAIQTLKGK